MARKRVNIAFISNEASRKATYRKRKKSVIKKTCEISTLCGVEACAVIYSPYDSHPEVWPPSHVGVQKVLSRFGDESEKRQNKRIMNQEDFLKERTKKANEQLKKLMKENREKEMIEAIYKSLLTGKLALEKNLCDLNDISWMIKQNMKEINRKLEVLSLRAYGQEMENLGEGAVATNGATWNKKMMYFGGSTL